MAVWHHILRVYCLVYCFMLGYSTEDVTPSPPSQSETVKEELQFRYKKSQYYLILGNHTHRETAEDLCKTLYGGSLAVANDDKELAALSFAVTAVLVNKARNVNNEFWMGGYTDNPHHKPTKLTETQPDNPNNSRRCLIISDWETPGTIAKYNLFSKLCTGEAREFICEVPDVEVFKYHVGRTPGKCPSGSKVASGYIVTSSATCITLEGQYKGNGVFPSVRCYLDWCGSNSSSSVTGVIAAKPGSCYSVRQGTGHIKAYKVQCQQLGGNPHNVDDRVTNCQLDFCLVEGGATSLTNYAISTRTRCPFAERVTEVMMSLKAADCKKLTQEDREPDFLGFVDCRVEMCRVVADCKKTELGKEYIGLRNRTISGKACQPWNRQTPHPHGNTVPSWFPERDVDAAGNKCRNPADWAEGPFCYTMDPAVPWEICDVPFCPGSGPRPLTFPLGSSHVIFVPGQHSDPDEFCHVAYGARMLTLETKHKHEALSEKIVRLRYIYSGIEPPEQSIPVYVHEIWIGGRTQSSKTLLDDLSEIDTSKEAAHGRCIMLSTWNQTTNSYGAHRFEVYGHDCPEFYRFFLCEKSFVEIKHYNLEGGKPNFGVHTKDGCIQSCKDPCVAVAFDHLEMSCFHYDAEYACRPGYKQSSVTFTLMQNCECHQLLINGENGVDDAAFSASSTFPDGPELYSPARARAGGVEVSDSGIKAGAWVPEVSDNKPWLQISFAKPRSIYGLITQGRDQGVGYVSLYALNYSADGVAWQSYKNKPPTTGAKEIKGNSDPETEHLVTLDYMIEATYIRIIPITWIDHIALRVEVIGCIYPQTNLALGKKIHLLDQEINTDYPFPALDGFMNLLESPRSSCATYSARFWTVDLDHLYEVHQIITYIPVVRCCTVYEHHMALEVRSSYMEDMSHRTRASSVASCPVSSFSKAGGRVVSDCPPATLGRFVTWRELASSVYTYNVLCEMQVYGKQIGHLINVALGKPAYSSHRSYPAPKLVDGNSALDQQQHLNPTDCMLFVKDAPNWWAVDLEDDYTIYKVTLATIKPTERYVFIPEGVRATEVLNIAVGSSMTSKGELADRQICRSTVWPKNANMAVTYACTKAVTGQWVKLEGKNRLTLCEVQVYGRRAPTKTYGGTGEGQDCLFPFLYNNTVYDKCISLDRKKLWCMTSNDTAVGNSTWGYCMDVRMREGRSAFEGRVEIRTGNRSTWGSVCDDGWNDVDARVVCSQLGLTGGKAVYAPFFIPSVHNPVMDSVACEGDEESLTDCPHSPTTDCSNVEDAGVICNAPDQVSTYIGYPAVKRANLDRSENMTVILHTLDQIPYPGYIASIKLYRMQEMPFLSFDVQVWRPTRDEGHFILMISKTVYGLIRSDSVLDYSLESNRYKVQPGDLLGFTWRKVNPIPYDFSLWCSKHKVYYRKYHLRNYKVGNTYNFQSKENSLHACKVYSISAEVIFNKHVSPNWFTYGTEAGTVWSQYYVAEGNFTQYAATTHCTELLGENATLAKFEDEQEYYEVSSVLLQAVINSTSMWISPHSSSYQDQAGLLWKFCQPEKGKRCTSLVLEESDTGDTVFMGTAELCNMHMAVLCERNYSYLHTQPVHSEINGTFIIAKSSGKSSSSVGTGFGIFFGIVLIALAAGGAFYFVRWYRRRQTIYIQPHMGRWSESTSPLHAAENPVYDVTAAESEADDALADTTQTDGHTLE